MSLHEFGLHNRVHRILICCCILLSTGCVSTTEVKKPLDWPEGIVNKSHDCSHFSGVYQNEYKDGKNIDPYLELKDGLRRIHVLTEGSLFFWLNTYAKDTEGHEGVIVTTEIKVEKSQIIVRGVNKKNKVSTTRLPFGKNLSCEHGKLLINYDDKGHSEGRTSRTNFSLVISKTLSGNLILHVLNHRYTSSALIVHSWKKDEKWILFDKLSNNVRPDN